MCLKQLLLFQGIMSNLMTNIPELTLTLWIVVWAASFQKGINGDPTALHQTSFFFHQQIFDSNKQNNQNSVQTKIRSTQSSTCIKLIVEAVNNWIQQIKLITEYQLGLNETFENYDFGMSNNCEEARENFEKSVESLSSLYFTLKSTNVSLSLKESNEVKSKYEEELRKLGNEINLLREQVTREITNKIDELRNEKENLKRKMDKSYHQLIALQVNYKNSLIDFCASEIDSGNLDNGEKIFSELNENRGEINRIINRSYSIFRMDKIIDFINKLRAPPDQVKAFDSLITKIKENNDFRSHHVRTIEFFFLKLIEEGEKFAEDLKRGGTNIEEAARVSIGAMVHQIKYYNYQSIIDYCIVRPYVIYKNMEKIIQGAFTGTKENCAKLVQFCSDLPDLEKSKLFYQMQKSGQYHFSPTLRLARELEEIINMPIFQHNSNNQTYEKVLTNVVEIKQKLPQTIRDLLWGSVCIKNEKENVYLIVKGNANNRSLGLSKDKEGSFKWILESIEESKKCRIKTEEDEYLFASNKKNLLQYAASKMLPREVGEGTYGSIKMKMLSKKNGHFKVQNGKKENSTFRTRLQERICMLKRSTKLWQFSRRIIIRDPKLSGNYLHVKKPFADFVADKEY